MTSPPNPLIKAGYRFRSSLRHLVNNDAAPARVTHQPDVYLFASHVGRRFGCTHVVDVGCGQPGELARLHPEFKVIGLGAGSNIELCRSRHRFGQWIDWNPEQDTPPSIPQEILLNSVIVCANTVEHLENSAPLLKTLKQLLEYAPVAIICTPERDLVHRRNHPSPPDDKAQGREWNRSEFRSLLDAAGFRIEFIGLTVGDNVNFRRDTTLAVLANNHAPPIKEAPADFRVVASMTVYNEEDIIVPSLTHLIDQGVDVYLIDNWSTDRTVERARPFLGRGVVAIERFPADGPSPTFDLAQILDREEQISTEIEADWHVHTDPDEIRASPWPDVTLKDALYHVDRLGFNAIDHTALHFLPIDNGYPDGSNFEQYFRLFEFNFVRNNQVKIWKSTGVRVFLGTGGHRVTFAGRRVFPYNFVYKHYPIRSQRHGERKIFRERQGRYNPEELAAGWHRHYDKIHPGHNFLREPAELLLFDESEFYEMYLVELLGNIGPAERAEWSALDRRRPEWRRLAGRLRRHFRLQFSRR